jgi:2',3'-cyclic-nucleotide 2'-phosphodiesterase (5'-nucleotidase family)
LSETVASEYVNCKSSGPSVIETTTATIDVSAPVSIIYSAGTRGNLLPITINGEERGGFAFRKAYIDRVSVDDHRLILSAGNFLFPNVLGLLDNGETVVRCFDAAGYDVVLAGNVDFHLGVEVLRARAAQANLSIIATNVLKKGKKFSLDEFKSLFLQERDQKNMISIPDSTSSFPLMPVSLIKRGGRLFAILGMVSLERYVKSVSSCPQVEVASAVSLTEEIVPYLKESGVDTVIILTTVDSIISTKLGAIDGVNAVIVSVPVNAPKEIKLLSESVISDGTKILFVPEGGLYIGQTSLSGTNSFSSPSRVRIDNSLGADAEMSILVEELDRELTEKHSAEITTFSSTGARDFKKICAEIARGAANCEISLLMKGSFQQEVLEGPFRIIDLWQTLPFEGTLSRTYMKGAYLQTFLNNSFEFFESAGISKSRDKWIINHRQLDPDITYSVALPTFVANGAYRLVNRGSEQCIAVIEVKNEFRDILQTYLSRMDLPERHNFKHLSQNPVVYTNNKISGSWSRVNANSQAADYGDAGVPGLSTIASTNLSSLFEGLWKRQDRTSDFTTSVRTKYQETDSVRTLDELVLETQYEYVSSALDRSRPFFNTELDTTLTANSLSGDSRPYKLKMALGYSFQMTPYSRFLIGASNLRFFGSLDGGATYGTDLTVKYDRTYADKGITIASRLNSYASYQSGSVYQLKWETACNVKIVGNLSFRLNYDMLFYKDDTIGDTAKTSQFFVGVGYQMLTRHF